ncbi:PREDICTED: mucin-22-like, partial [Tauraco erythrolophus]|uniref:mucin-22-like n=1 Tax=Tauraco erythrolophus TaxID=121530 RepID=UPI0005232EFD
QPKAPLKCSKECGRFTSEVAVKRIRSYRRTEPRCPRRAIILITLKSVELCADPEAEWVKKIVQKLDQEKAAASPLPPDATSAAAPAKPGVFQNQVGLRVTASPQAFAPTSLSQGTGTTVLEIIRVPAAGTEVSSRSSPATQNTTQLPAGSSPVIQEIAARSEVTPEANRDSLTSPPPSTTFAAGMVSSQPTSYPMALVHGFDKAVGSTEEPVGHTANATAYDRDTASPSSNSDPTAITKGSIHPVLSTNESLDPASARTNAPDAAFSSFSSGLPSILDSTEITTVPTTPVPPETASVSTLNPTTAIDGGPSVRTKVVSSSADASGTRTFDYSSSVGKQDPSDTLVFTSQAFSGQDRVQMTTERPNDLPLPSFLSRSQMHSIIPVSLVGGLMACSVAAVWLYLKFGVKTEEMSKEMVQSLLWKKKGHENNVYPMELI